MDQDRVIDAFIKAHNEAVGSSYLVSKHPDRVNRNSLDIDAYAESNGRQPMAIEHTKINSLQDQRRDAHWFEKTFSSLETELSGRFPFSFEFIFPYNSVTPGQKWGVFRNAIRDWFLECAPNLPEGRNTPSISGVPFRIIVSKRPSSRHRVYVFRQHPPGDKDILLLAEMQKSLEHKYDKLAEYREQGAVTVLVVETEDFALVSDQDIYKSFVLATRQQPRLNLDQVWLARTSGEDCNVYCFLGPHEVMAAVNPDNFRFGPEYASEW